MPHVSGSEIKVVGKSGQISLGKNYAGRALRVDRRRDGTIVLTAVAVVPENQLWTLQEPDRSRIARGLAWASTVAPKETALDSLHAPRQKAARSSGRRR